MSNEKYGLFGERNDNKKCQASNPNGGNNCTLEVSMVWKMDFIRK